jgi:hypothetical protein
MPPPVSPEQQAELAASQKAPPRQLEESAQLVRQAPALQVKGAHSMVLVKQLP